MKSTVQKVTIFLFCAFLLAFGVLFLLWPKREFSDKENRTLAEFPEFTAEKFFSGKWGLDFETYLSDQFPLRDNWVVLKAACQMGTGRQDNNGVYFGDQLIQTFWSVDQGQLEKNLAALKAFGEKAPGKVYFAPVANAVEVNGEKLPLFAPDVDQEALLEEMREFLEESPVELVDTLPALREHRDEGLYFNTDHHINTLGAYYVYRDLANALGKPALTQEAFRKETVTDRFEGTLYHKSGAWWVAPDKIELWQPVAGLRASVTIEPGGERHEGLYFEEELQGNDPYAVFLKGNQALEVVETDRPGGKLLVVKDSYAHIITPFLANHFSEIHLLDLRYYKLGVSQYMEENGIDKVLVLYNLSNFTEDVNVQLIGQ